jgi:hypothetical protein
MDTPVAYVLMWPVSAWYFHPVPHRAWSAVCPSDSVVT